jgi:hypothetical protein
VFLILNKGFHFLFIFPLTSNSQSSQIIFQTLAVWLLVSKASAFCTLFDLVISPRAISLWWHV